MLFDPLLEFLSSSLARGYGKDLGFGRCTVKVAGDGPVRKGRGTEPQATLRNGVVNDRARVDVPLRTFLLLVCHANPEATRHESTLRVLQHTVQRNARLEKDMLGPSVARHPAWSKPPGPNHQTRGRLGCVPFPTTELVCCHAAYSTPRVRLGNHNRGGSGAVRLERGWMTRSCSLRTRFSSRR